MACRHGVLSDFKVGAKWKCSGCGRVGAWSHSWSYFGCLSCRKCRSEPAIEFVACSQACRTQWPQTMPTPDVEHVHAERTDKILELREYISHGEAKLAKLR